MSPSTAHAWPGLAVPPCEPGGVLRSLGKYVPLDHLVRPHGGLQVVGAEHLPEPLGRLDEARARAVIEPQARLPLPRVRRSYAAAAGPQPRRGACHRAERAASLRGAPAMESFAAAGGIGMASPRGARPATTRRPGGGERRTGSGSTRLRGWFPATSSTRRASGLCRTRRRGRSRRCGDGSPTG